MTCAATQAQLVGFHFGALEARERAAVEAHLVGCRECLSAFLTLKRDVEGGAEEVAPPATLRLRVRASVAKELGLVASPPVWWQRPLAVGLAAAAVVVGVMTVQLVSHAPGRPPVGLQRAP